MEIILNNCGKNYHRSWLFQGIHLNLSFSLPNQAPLRLAVLGANGAGKSTFTLMLAGQTDPTEGSISWFNNDGVAINQSQWHKYVSLASPGMELPEEFTLSEWFDFHQRIKGFQSSITLRLLMDICGFSQNTQSKQLLTFSSGMKQRVKLCSAILGEHPLVIVDEPLTNLDKAGTEVFQTLLSDYLGNRALMIASNREDEWVAHCTHHYTIGETAIKAI